MKTKVDALYDLAKKVAGSAKKDDSIVEMIDQITAGYSGGGSGAGFHLINLTTEDDEHYEITTETKSYLDSLTSENLPAGLLVNVQGNGYEFLAPMYFNSVAFTGNKGFRLYCYNDMDDGYTILVLSYDEGWEADYYQDF